MARFHWIATGSKLASVLFVLALAAPAWAEGDDRPASEEEARRVTEVLTDRGYTDVHDVELDDGRFEADARNPEGHEVDIELDVETLDVLREDRD